MTDPLAIIETTIGEALFLLRRRGKMTAAELSKASGLTIRKVRIIEQDDYKRYRVSDVVAAFDVFGITPGVRLIPKEVDKQEQPE
jgi:transcriptional regulator with XRE-family HTH domain